MDRLSSITEFWNWLPAFRAIGESLHLPTAARSLHLSPSALSRALRQLEKSLGRDLFRRDHRRLELTREGEQLLGSLRDAMRIVHEASEAVQVETLRGPLRIASTGVATSTWVLPAALRLRSEHPLLVPEITSDLADIVPRLLSGRIDIAFTSQPIAHPRLRSERIAVATAGVYCGPIHPLFDRPDVALAEVLDCAFVAPPPEPSGAQQDGWPATLPRKVALVVDRMRLGCEAAIEAPLLVVLPDVVAERLGRGNLRRLGVDIVPAVPVYAVLRPALDRSQAAEVMLRGVQLEAATGSR
jgi:DNA-binding transcriptional LysR family regulator